MTLVRMNVLDTGFGGDIQIDAGTSANLLMRSNEGGQWMTRVADEGARTVLAGTASAAPYAFGGVQQLAGGGFVVFGTIHSGLGRGVMLQTYNAAGRAVGRRRRRRAEYACRMAWRREVRRDCTGDGARRAASQAL